MTTLTEGARRMAPRTSITPRGEGRRMDLRKLARLGESLEARRAGEQSDLDAIADELIGAGELANIALAAKLSGVSRDALYRRVRARRAALEAA